MATDYIFQRFVTSRHLHWIFKGKCVLESQDADLEVSQGSYVPKNLSTRRTMPLKWSKILRNPSKSFEILQISNVSNFFIVENVTESVSRWGPYG